MSTVSSISSPRRDISAIDAWEGSKRGRGTIVAVLDSFIQWDHPDLKNNIYQVGNFPDKYLGEVYGWDFSCLHENPYCTGDRDTRINKQEMNIVHEQLRDAFQLPDNLLFLNYPSQFERLRQWYPHLSFKELAYLVRLELIQEKVFDFHGTQVSGVIAANPQQAKGIFGVAPEAKILPVRIFGLDGQISSAAIIKGIDYAASRKVDVINMSYGAPLPHQAVVKKVREILDANPQLVIVASAGNDGYDQLKGSSPPNMGFPAGLTDVVAVGATNLKGKRAGYSSFGVKNCLLFNPDGNCLYEFGHGLTVVGPGGDFSNSRIGGILTTGGTWSDRFWGEFSPWSDWGINYDRKGKYIWTQGTSFSAPAVAGVIALMKAEAPQLYRQQLIQILRDTASYDGLSLTPEELKFFNFLVQRGEVPISVSARQFYFGTGLVNADAALKQIRANICF
ncbi:MAG: S8 family serine peptidase [Prochloraceae cyanobacterium]|nr:S8 family serine peptidase [Prochloraceae cyanobacterium]